MLLACAETKTAGPRPDVTGDVVALVRGFFSLATRGLGRGRCHSRGGSLNLNHDRGGGGDGGQFTTASRV